jgi:hypothetical protein
MRGITIHKTKEDMTSEEKHNYIRMFMERNKDATDLYAYVIALKRVCDMGYSLNIYEQQFVLDNIDRIRKDAEDEAFNGLEEDIDMFESKLKDMYQQAKFKYLSTEEQDDD